jgi:ABC-type glycerol-3-phosphate transport system substrate-binding protein
VRATVRKAILCAEVAACAVVVLVCSCGGSRAAIIRLATDRPEFAGYAEIFNQGRPDVKLELVYAADPRATLEDRVPPDIVVTDRLACRQYLSRFHPLDDLFRRGGLRRASFYPGSLELGVADGRQRALPVNVELPAVVFRESPSTDLTNGIVLEYTDLRAKGAEFNARNAGRYTRVGFSPLWNTSFLAAVAVLGPPAYEGNADCRLSWKNPELTTQVDLLRSWVRDVNGGLSGQQEFADRYLYEPFTELLRGGRILFYYVSSSELFRLGASRLQDLDFRWLSVDDRIPVLSQGLSMGIPRDARHKAAARVFLRWFFSAEGQAAILAESSEGKMRGETFGIAGGLSALPEVNERALAQYHPLLIGHIPTPEFLRFPQGLPADWEDIRDSLVRPWLVEAVTRVSDPGQSLAQELTGYLKDGVDQLRRDRR